MANVPYKTASFFHSQSDLPQHLRRWGGCGSSMPSLLVGIQKLGVLRVQISLSIYASDLI